MLTALTDLLTELLNSILIYRVKDVHDTIRALCITRLGQSPPCPTPCYALPTP